jgi:hypothetical protein
MAFDATSGGGEPHDSPCKGCGLLVLRGQPAIRVEFKGSNASLSGLYHDICGRPYRSMERVLNLNPNGL